MPQAGFKTAIPVIQWPQTGALDRTPLGSTLQFSAPPNISNDVVYFASDILQYDRYTALLNGMYRNNF